MINQEGKVLREDRYCFLNQNGWAKNILSADKQVSILSGAAIFIKKDLFLKVSGFDEKIFLYHEDDDLAIRLKKEIGPLMYINNSKVTHVGGGSSSRNTSIAALKGYYMGKSRVYAQAKHKIKGVNLRNILLASFQLISPEMILSARKRAKYIAFFKGVIEQMFYKTRSNTIMIFVTGGAGFIGSNFILKWMDSSNEDILNIDNLSYAANLKNLDSISSDSRYKFVEANIQDQNTMEALLEKYKPRAIFNFAAESHVDKSIEGPDAFINANILGTFSLLSASLNFYKTLEEEKRDKFRFIHISTDEVFGSLSIV